MIKRLLTIVVAIFSVFVTLGQTTELCPGSTLVAGLRGLSLDLRGRLYATGYTDPRSTKPAIVSVNTHTGKLKTHVRLPEGCNATALRHDAKGNLYLLDRETKAILYIKGSRVRKFAALDDVQHPENMVITPRGYLYVSDRGEGRLAGKLWMVRPTGDVVKLEERMGAVSGVEVSPDGGTLYVTEARQRHLWAYDIRGDGQLTAKRLLCRFEGFAISGIRCDHEGNIYVAREGKGTIEVLTPQGEPLREVRLRGFRPGNISVGDGVIYVTSSDRGAIEMAR